jgi:hypothetical protein
MAFVPVQFVRRIQIAIMTSLARTDSKYCRQQQLAAETQSLMIWVLLIMVLLGIAGSLAAVREALEEDTRTCC